MCINDKKMPEHEVIEKYKVNLQNELLGNIYLKINWLPFTTKSVAEFLKAEKSFLKQQLHSLA